MAAAKKGGGREPKANARAAIPKSRIPRALRNAPETRPGSGCPLFSFRLVDRTYDGSFGWPKLTQADAHALHTFFHECGCKTWQTLCSESVAGLPKHHAQAIDTLEKEAQTRLKALRLDDLDELFRLRLTGKRRLWGFRGDGDEFYVLWWDPDHTVYIVKKA